MNCIWCGNSLKGLQTKFCSRNCNRRYYDDLSGRIATRERKDTYPYICKYCGAWCYAEDIRRTNYCDNKCSRLARYNYARIYYCNNCGRVMSDNKKHCSEDCFRGYQRKCEICGVSFLGTEGARFHSRDCELEYGRRQYMEKAVANYDVKELICTECGKKFTPEYGNKRRLFCSDKCLKKKWRRVGKAARKAMKRGNESDRIDPFAILGRDKWTCQICGIKTPQKLRGTYLDNAPEVDHIIPSSAGGGDVAHNLQCACRKCNQLKSDSIVGQLILFTGVDYNAEPQETYSTSRD